MLFLTWGIFEAEGVGYCNIYLPVCLQIPCGPSLALHQTRLTLQTTLPRLSFCLGWAKRKYLLVDDGRECGIRREARISLFLSIL